MRKCIWDNMVAVLLAKERYRRWYTKHKIRELLFDPVVVELTLKDQRDKHQYIAQYVDSCYEGAVETIPLLTVVWVKKDSLFTIDIQDGLEMVIVQDSFDWQLA